MHIDVKIRHAVSPCLLYALRLRANALTSQFLGLPYGKSLFESIEANINNELNTVALLMQEDRHTYSNGYPAILNVLHKLGIRGSRP